MKKGLCVLLAALLLCTATGCSSVFESEYYYESPVTGDFGASLGEATEVRNYSMLKTALTDMISRHEAQGEFRLNNYNGSPSEDLAAACFEIKMSNPLGAYAVENISYETSYVVSYYMATIFVSYKRTAEEMADVVYAVSAAELEDCVRQAMAELRPATVVRLYSLTMDEERICRTVKDCFYDDPVSLVRRPQVTVTTYPVEGANRIYQVELDYGMTPALNTALSLALSTRLRSAQQAMREQEPLYLSLEAAAYLSDQCAGGEAGDYPDTAYGAIVEGCADSRGVALAYKALCDRLSIPCLVVEGQVRGVGMEPHFWNIITLDEDCYHVDISAFGTDPAGAFLLSDDALWGEYIWETEEYPVCAGALSYADAARLEPDQESTQTAVPEETMDPTQTPHTEEEPPTSEPPESEESEKST